MIQTAVLLDAGRGSKLWPYAQVRSKGMVPIANVPVLGRLVEALKHIGVTDIIIVGGEHAAGARNYFRNDPTVRVIEDHGARGAVFSLCAAKEYLTGDFLALYGDTIMSESDLRALAQAQSLPAALVYPLRGRGNDYVTCQASGDHVTGFLGHPRSESGDSACAGFAFSAEQISCLEKNSGRFTAVQVGMMPPLEGYIEMSLHDFVKDGGAVTAIRAGETVVDIDKPWHILEADDLVRGQLCGALTENRLDTGAQIHPSAAIEGFVRLGKNSRVGRNVLIEGNVIVGDDTVIDNGAILRGHCVIGDHCTIRDGCLIDGSTVGHRCYIGHGAEFGGLLMNGAYLFHYMEISGLVGENVDFGAATVCGSLRFDDGVTRHRTQGRLEQQHPAGDACYVGDYCRTGVNAILMPGVKTGVYSVVGAGVTLLHDLEDRTLVYSEQSQVKKAWGPEKYGW